ncbi:MAG: hypothetical protein AAFP90_01050 [Planctomycetota bacterium]
MIVRLLFSATITCCLFALRVQSDDAAKNSSSQFVSSTSQAVDDAGRFTTVAPTLIAGEAERPTIEAGKGVAPVGWRLTRDGWVRFADPARSVQLAEQKHRSQQSRAEGDQSLLGRVSRSVQFTVARPMLISVTQILAIAGIAVWYRRHRDLQDRNSNTHDSKVSD